MATVENWSSRTVVGGTRDRRTLTFDIIGSDDDATAEADLLLNAPATWGGLPLSAYTLTWKSLGVYAAEVEYQLETDPQDQVEPANVGSTTGQVSLTIGGETVHRTHSDSTVASYGPHQPGYDPPDHGNAIGVGNDGEIEGCDVLVPTITYRETHYFLPASLTSAYRNTVEDLAGTVNNATFKGRAAGEVRFDGAEFSLSDGERVVATYSFSISKNKTGLSIGGLTGIAKDGWDYLWVKTLSNVDANSQAGAEIIGVYVERVYPREDFSALQIGT